MDWLPTLLAAAGTAPEPAFPPDGMNLLPWLTQDAAPSSRKLFWRYKANAQRAARDGDYKFLKILDRHVPVQCGRGPDGARQPQDPPQGCVRASGRRVVRWNQSMLPEVNESSTASFTGDQLADHIGAKKASSAADNPAAPPASQPK